MSVVHKEDIKYINNLPGVSNNEDRVTICC